MKKFVGIASTPDRIEGLLDTIRCLSPQVDHIYAWLNQYPKLPITEFKNVTFYNSEEDKGDLGKILILDQIQDKDFYLFTCDDDIIYPKDYVSKNIELYTSGTIQTSHSKLFPQIPIKSFSHDDISGNYFGGYIANKHKVHAVGTGVSMMDSTVALSIPRNDFNIPNMLDVWLSCWAFQHDIELFQIPHNAGWLYDNPKIDQSNGLWESQGKWDDSKETYMFNYYHT